MQADEVKPNKHASIRQRLTTKAPLNLSVCVLRTRSDLTEHKDQWKQLEQSSKSNAVFQSFAWTMAMLENLEADQGIQIFAVFDQQKLIAAMPLRIENLGVLRVLTGLADPFQQYSEMLLSPNYNPSAILELLKPHLHETGADIIHLRQIREASALYDYANEHFSAVGDVDGAPYLDLTQWASFEDYLKSISSRTRKTIRNQRNRLHKSAGLSHRIIRQQDPELESLLLQSLKGRENWVEAMGYSSRALEGEGFQQFLFALCKEAGSECELVAFELKHGDVPISTEWGFLFKRCYFAYMADWNSDYEQSSPANCTRWTSLRLVLLWGLKRSTFSSLLHATK